MPIAIDRELHAHAMSVHKDLLSDTESAWSRKRPRRTELRLDSRQSYKLAVTETHEDNRALLTSLFGADNTRTLSTAELSLHEQLQDPRWKWNQHMFPVPCAWRHPTADQNCKPEMITLQNTKVQKVIKRPRVRWQPTRRVKNLSTCHIRHPLIQHSDGSKMTTPPSSLERKYLAYVAALNKRPFPGLTEHMHSPVSLNGNSLALPDFQKLLTDDIDNAPDMHFKLRMLVVDEPKQQVGCRIEFTCTPSSGQFMGYKVQGTVKCMEHMFYQYRDGKIATVWWMPSELVPAEPNASVLKL